MTVKYIPNTHLYIDENGDLRHDSDQDSCPDFIVAEKGNICEFLRDLLTTVGYGMAFSRVKEHDLTKDTREDWEKVVVKPKTRKHNPSVVAALASALPQLALIKDWLGHAGLPLAQDSIQETIHDIDEYIRPSIKAPF